jgi:hypothetical protein
MDERISPQVAFEPTGGEEANLEQLFAEMDRLNILMRQDQADIDRLKAETHRLRLEMQPIKTETQAVLAKLKRAV